MYQCSCWAILYYQTFHLTDRYQFLYLHAVKVHSYVTTV